MRKRFGLMVLTAVALFASGAGQAAAEGGTYPPSPSSSAVFVDKPTVKIGESLTVSAKGLCTTAPVVFEFVAGSTTGQVISSPITVASDGTASFTFNVPGPADPSYLAWAKQPSCSIKLSTPVVVKAAGSTAPSPFAPPAVSAIKASASLPITLSASNLCPGENATFTLSNASGKVASTTLMASAGGTADATLAAQAAGDYTLTITQACGTNSSSPFRVESLPPAPAPAVPTPGAGPVKLPTTGSDQLHWMQVAFVASLSGVALVLTTIRRRRDVSAVG